MITLSIVLVVFVLKALHSLFLMLMRKHMLIPELVPVNWAELIKARTLSNGPSETHSGEAEARFYRINLPLLYTLCSISSWRDEKKTPSAGGFRLTGTSRPLVSDEAWRERASERARAPSLPQSAASAGPRARARTARGLFLRRATAVY